MNTDLETLRNNVIEAAKKWNSESGWTVELANTVDALLAAEQPQPVECLMTRHDCYAGPAGWGTAMPLGSDSESGSAEVWRVTITPLERVR